MWPFRRGAKLTVPTIDPAVGDPDAATMLDHLANRNWRPVHDFLRTVEDPDDFAWYVDIAAETTGMQAWIGEWIEAEPRSALPVLVRGAHAIRWAWQARGRARANETSTAQFQMFGQRLKLAEDCLDEAVQRAPNDPTGWALLIVTGMGRGLGVDESHRRFTEATARYRWHRSAHSRMFGQLCAKWGGSHEQMHSFVDETVAGAPAGSRLGALVPRAHIERWLDLPDGPDRAHMRQPEVRAALHWAADRSVRHPDYRRRPGWPDSHNSFAMAFWLANEHAALAEQFDALGDLVTRYPWDYLAGEPAERFARARAQAYRERTSVPG